MVRRIGISGNYAVAYAVKMADVDMIAAYPITPQTTIVEKLSEFVANGELDASYMNVESEHSAISACVGASLTGARVFTATSSQGLALMHEILFMASALRTPIVMANVNRALSAPLNIWNDHSDAMAQRDAGWIQLWVRSAQEAFDATVESFKIAEETRLPVMVNMDGFIVSHMYEPVELPDEEEIRKFIPSRPLENRVSTKRAHAVGVVGPPEYYYEMKYQAIDAIEESRPKIKEIDNDFNSRFGKSYSEIDTYGIEEADAALILMGSIFGSAKEVANALRRDGKNVGVISLRVFRPFPVQELRRAIEGIRAVGVVDRATSPGGSGNPLYNEVATALYDMPERPVIQGFVAGLGGRDIREDDFRLMYDATQKAAREGAGRCIYVGLRE
ncbi:MAG: Pyruvate:ferredoxin oxidoreductase, alpha subunit [Candidatus Methanosuratincola subterraneus]|uniref:Pyruvate:ferredoxin oxidoreductase, alpha subunit n=1 Tax=Methanosuratincola subterraneus TaxID=2593994 RepID=A0A3S3RCI9_METS7|nr:MAG: Pyruvate:ferredoxin oxidoreductase, alpha subunit [Candidatus Methanosuratincola subterraneus]